MSTTTPNFELFKPDYTDAPDIKKAVSDNMDKIDSVGQQIMQNTAQIETFPNATNSHANGEYVMLNNVLYKVTATNGVAAKEAWAVGGNITVANIGNEIATLTNNLTKQQNDYEVFETGIGNYFSKAFGFEIKVRNKYFIAFCGVLNVNISPWTHFINLNNKSNGSYYFCDFAGGNSFEIRYDYVQNSSTINSGTIISFIVPMPNY